MAIAELPSWLAVEQRYEPAGARHRVMQKNVLHLASLLERVRLGGGANEGGSMVDRALSCVSAPVRLVGMFVCVLCVCLTQSPLYLMLMAATALVLVAVRPVRGLRATFVPALATAGFAVVLALPALLLGASATDAMLKIALKTFINVSFVLGVSWTLTWSRMSRRLRCCACPTRSSLPLIWHSSISRCWDARRTICANRSCCAALAVRLRGFRVPIRSRVSWA